jgi:glycosyltransferase involved in cell wall biosynthesis
MRIAFVVPHISPGGVETYLFRLGSFFKSQGHEVVFISTNKEGAWWSRVDELGFTSRLIALKKYHSKIGHVHRVGEILVNGRFDVLLLNHAPYGQLALGLLPDKVAAITVNHNDTDFVYQVTILNSDACNAVISISPKTDETLKRILPGRSVVYIPHGVSLPEENAYKHRIGISSPLKLLFVGRISHRQKGVLLLPDIINLCQKRGIVLRLTIIGEGNDLESLKAKIKESVLEGAVQFLGTVSPEEVYCQMLAHHIVLLPSFYEGFPLTPLEAQACGCVPIMSLLPSITDAAISNGKTGILVPPNEPAAFSDAIGTLYENRNLWKTMSENGHRRIIERFTVEAMGNAYLKLISEILNGKYPLPHSRSGKILYQEPFLTKRDWKPLFIDRLFNRGKKAKS